MQAQQQAQIASYAKKLNDNDSDNLMFDNEPNQDEEDDPLKRAVKPKRFKGLLEWVMEQEGHDFLVEIDRSYIKNKENLIGLKEKLREELNMKDD